MEAHEVIREIKCHGYAIETHHISRIFISVEVVGIVTEMAMEAVESPVKAHG